MEQKTILLFFCYRLTNCKEGLCIAKNVATKSKQYYILVRYHNRPYDYFALFIYRVNEKQKQKQTNKYYFVFKSNTNEFISFLSIS